MNSRRGASHLSVPTFWRFGEASDVFYGLVRRSLWVYELSQRGASSTAFGTHGAMRGLASTVR